MTSRREREQKQHRYASARKRAEQHEKQFESTAVRVPQGVEVFRFTNAKTYRLDILPYLVKTGSDQPGGNPYCDEGFLHYERTFHSHFIPTPEGDRYYCCPIKTFKERRCPVCEHLATAERTGTLDDDTIRKIKPKERQLFNIIDLDEKDKGVQLFEFNFWEFGKVLDEKVKAKEKYEGFYALEGGRTVEVTVKADHTFSTPRFKPINLEFEDREDYPEEILEKVLDLDSLLKHVSYEELKKVYLPAGEVEVAKEVAVELVDESEEETSPTPPAPVKRTPTTTQRPSAPIDAKGRVLAVGDLVRYQGEEMEILAISTKGLLTLEQQEPDQEWPNVLPGKVTKITVKESTPAPAKNHAPTKIKLGKVDEDFDEEPEEEEEIEFEGDEDEEDSDDLDEEDIEEEDRSPAPRKGPGRPRRPA